MKIGDRVSIIPSWSFGRAGEAGLREHPSEEKATVVWIHPPGEIRSRGVRQRPQRGVRSGGDLSNLDNLCIEYI